MRNPVYKGKVIVAAWAQEKEQIVEGLHEGVVTEELFNTVQDIIVVKTRLTKKPGKKEPNLPLKGHLLCPRCNKKLTGSGSISRDKTMHYYYHCQKGCKERVRADLMNSAFISFMNELTVKKEVADLYYQVLLDVYKSNEGDRKKKIYEIDVEIQKLKQVIFQVENRLFEAKLDLETFNNGKERYTKAISDLQYEKEELKNLDSDLMNQVRFSLSLLQKLGKLYESSCFEVRQKLIGSIFPEKLIFSKNKYRTTHLNSVLALLVGKNGDFKGFKKAKAPQNARLPNMAPPLGFEPRTY